MTAMMMEMMINVSERRDRFFTRLAWALGASI
jgi:hypothetical protein